MRQVLISSCLLVIFAGCQHHSGNDTPIRIFADSPIAVLLKPGFVDEASGIADSRSNNGFLWVEQDSGNPPDLSLLSYDGIASKKMVVKNAVNRDWEEMCLSRGPEANAWYIYLADIGDNFLQYDSYTIFRFKEPVFSTDTISNYEKIDFAYPDGSNNAEAILVDALSKDIFVITKSDIKTNIYKLAYPQKINNMNQAVLVGSLPFTIVVGAAISEDGSEIVVKTYGDIFYWKRGGTESIDQTLKRPAAKLVYQLEIQGEAIGFRNDNAGFFTLSEKPSLVSAVKLNFYKRK